MKLVELLDLQLFKIFVADENRRSLNRLKKRIEFWKLPERKFSLVGYILIEKSIFSIIMQYFLLTSISLNICDFSLPLCKLLRPRTALFYNRMSVKIYFPRIVTNCRWQLSYQRKGISKDHIKMHYGVVLVIED